jgi:hypothetical protein
MTDGSYFTSTTSAWWVVPLHTSLYEGCVDVPPAYPTAVSDTPSSDQNKRSAPQKQPMPNTAVCMLSIRTM